MALAWCAVALASALYEFSRHSASAASSVRASQPWACGDCVPNGPRYSCVTCSLGRQSAQLTAKSRGIELAELELHRWLPNAIATHAFARIAFVKVIQLCVASHEWSLVSGVAFTALWLSKVWASAVLLPALSKWFDDKQALLEAARKRRTSELLAQRAALSLAPQLAAASADANHGDPSAPTFGLRRDNADDERQPLLRRRLIAV